MSTTTVVLIVVAFLVHDLIVLGAIISFVRYTTRDLLSQFPAREPAPDAVRANFQSFRIGMIGLGGSVHVAADADALHLSPARLARWCGVRPMSIPWDKIRIRKRGKRTTHATVGMTDVTGPNWCFELADAAPVRPGATGATEEAGLGRLPRCRYDRTSQP